MKKAIGIIVLSFLLSSNAHASWAYLWGFQTGYRFGQVAVGSNYCLPENLQLNLQNVEDIVDEQAKKMNNPET